MSGASNQGIRIVDMTQVSTLLKHQDAVTIAAKLNAAEGEAWTYVPRDAGNGRGIIVWTRMAWRSDSCNSPSAP